MIFGHRNVAPRASVYDVEGCVELSRVIGIDAAAGTVTRTAEPLRIAADGESVETEVLHFRTIYPIHGGGPRPCLFHCYGRQ